MRQGVSTYFSIMRLGLNCVLCRQWRMQAEGLKEQLAKRPPVERVEELNRELREQEIILQGTMRENEKCIAEADR